MCEWVPSIFNSPSAHWNCETFMKMEAIRCCEASKAVYSYIWRYNTKSWSLYQIPSDSSARKSPLEVDFYWRNCFRSGRPHIFTGYMYSSGEQQCISGNKWSLRGTNFEVLRSASPSSWCQYISCGQESKHGSWCIVHHLLQEYKSSGKLSVRSCFFHYTSGRFIADVIWCWQS